MPDFINTEHCVEKLFPVGTTFSFEGKKYQVALCGKPRPARGECKTDVYIKGIASDGEAREIKIYNPQIQISAESETKRSIFRKRDKTKRSKKESAQHSKSRNKSFVMTSVSAL